MDPLLIRLTRELVRPGHVVWDIGANVGLFSFAAATAAAPGGMVVAIEADIWLAGVLRRSLRIPNTRADIEVLPAAVGAAAGVGRFAIAARSRATNHLAGFGSSQTGGVRAVQAVPVLSLDQLIGPFPAPDIVKIDVEGAEVDVLTGAHHILREVAPIVICEVTATNSAAVTRLLRGSGYQLLDATEPAADRRPLMEAAWSTLAVPMTAIPAARPAAQAMDIGTTNVSGPDLPGPCIPTLDDREEPR